MDENISNIPYFAHEGEVTRLERINKRQWILTILIFLAFIITNVGWIIYETKFETVSVTQDVETNEGTTVVSGTGDIYGEN